MAISKAQRMELMKRAMDRGGQGSQVNFPQTVQPSITIPPSPKQVLPSMEIPKEETSSLGGEDSILQEVWRKIYELSPLKERFSTPQTYLNAMIGMWKEDKEGVQKHFPKESKFLTILDQEMKQEESPVEEPPMDEILSIGQKGLESLK